MSAMIAAVVTLATMFAAEPPKPGRPAWSFTPEMCRASAFAL